MERIELKAQVRTEHGKGPSRRLRAEKLIPAVLYGPHADAPMGIAVDPLALRAAINTPKKLNTILTLVLDNGSERTVLLKDYQNSVLRFALTHADFLDVRMDEKVAVKVPLQFVGISVGVTEGGILQTLRRELEVLTLPGNIPEKIEVDVSNLKVSQSIHLKDLKFPEGVSPRLHINVTIVGVVAPDKEEGPTRGAEAAAATPAPGAAAPAAAAAAPAAKKEPAKK